MDDTSIGETHEGVEEPDEDFPGSSADRGPRQTYPAEGELETNEDEPAGSQESPGLPPEPHIDTATNPA